MKQFLVVRNEKGCSRLCIQMPNMHKIKSRTSTFTRRITTFINLIMEMGQHFNGVLFLGNQ